MGPRVPVAGRSNTSRRLLHAAVAAPTSLLQVHDPPEALQAVQDVVPALDRLQVERVLDVRAVRLEQARNLRRGTRREAKRGASVSAGAPRGSAHSAVPLPPTPVRSPSQFLVRLVIISTRLVDFAVEAAGRDESGHLPVDELGGDPEGRGHAVQRHGLVRLQELRRQK